MSSQNYERDQDETPVFNKNIQKVQVVSKNINRRVVDLRKNKRSNCDDTEFNIKNLIMKTKVKLMRLAYLAYKKMIGSKKKFIILSKPLKAIAISGSAYKCKLPYEYQ